MRLEAFHPVVGQAELAGIRERPLIELRLDGVELFTVIHHGDHFFHQIGGNAAIQLLELALGLERETRPQRQHIAFVVGEHAVEIAGCVDEADGLEITVAESQGARQRERHGIDAGHLGALRHDLRIIALPYDPDIVARAQFLADQRGGPHRGIADGLGVIGHHGQVVQRVDELHLAGDFDRTVEGDAHIAQGERHRVAVHHHQAMLRVDDEAGAVIILLGHPGHRIGHVEGHHHQGRSELVDARIAGLGVLRARRRHGGGQGAGLDADARPDPQGIVALALARRKPAPVDAHHLELRGVRILQGDVAHRGARTVREGGQCRLEIRERIHFLAVELTDERAARNAGAREDISGVGDVHALDGQVVMPCLLIRERVHHRFAEFEVLIGRDGAQGLHVKRMLQRHRTALHLDLDLGADVRIEHVLEGEEFRHGLAVDRHQDVAGRQHAVRGRPGLHVVDHQHARELRIRPAHARFGGGVEPEPPKLIVGRVLEHGLERAARHGLALVDVLERPHHRRQRQIKTRLRAGGAAGIERHHPPLDIDHRRTRGAPGGARGGLIIEGVEVVVLAVTVFRGFAIEACQRAREDGQLLAGIVADHADFAADHRARGIQRQLRRFNEAQLRRVVAIDAEVVNGVSVHGIELHLLAILEGGLRGHRPRRDHMPVRENESALGIDDEAGGLGGGVPFGIEGTRAVDLDGDHAARDPLQRLRPIGRRTLHRGHGDRYAHGSGHGLAHRGGTAHQTQSQHQGKTQHGAPSYSTSVIGQDQEPHGSKQEKTQHDGGRTHVLRHSSEWMALGAGSVDHRLDRAVQDLDHQNQEHRRHQQGALHPRVAEVQAERNHEQGKNEFLAKGGFFAPRMPEALE